MGSGELLRAALVNDGGGNVPAALLQCRAILASEPQNVMALEFYSALLLSVGRHRDSADACDRALAVDPGSETAASNLRASLEGMLMEAVCDGRVEDVLGASDRLHGLERGADEAKTCWERGQYRLLVGDFAAGWPLYESRLRLPDFIGQKHLLAATRWDGSPYRGLRLLVHGEQGYGDTLMMLRYLRMAKELGGTLLAFVQPPLAPLAATCLGPDRVFDSIEGGPVDFDIQLPMMSLPSTLGIDPRAAVSGEPCPYLRVPDHVPNRERIDALVDGRAAVPGRRIGLVWSGRPTHKRDGQRSIPPALLAPLGEVGADWFTLQREEPELAPFPGAVPLGGLLETFADTAHAIGRMDILVTVDTCAAHLAGALGVPAMLLVTCLPDWRWQLLRSDSPWYPGTRIFRQREPGDWQGVVGQVAAALNGL